jgi:hypothetical protein
MSLGNDIRHIGDELEKRTVGRFEVFLDVTYDQFGLSFVRHDPIDTEIRVGFLHIIFSDMEKHNDGHTGRQQHRNKGGS